MKEKIKLIFKSLAMFFILLGFSSFFFSILLLNPENMSDKEYLIYLSIANFISLGIFIWIYRKTLINDFYEFKKDIKQNLILSVKYWFIGFLIMVFSNLFITFVLNKQIAGNEETVRNFLKIFPLLMFLDTSIYAPISEELTFRKSIKDVIGNKYLYVLVSGLVFGLLHIIGYIHDVSDLVYIIPYSSLGIVFALLYHRTDNIYSTIIMHSFHNTMAIILYLLGAAI